MRLEAQNGYPVRADKDLELRRLSVGNTFNIGRWMLDAVYEVAVDGLCYVY